MEKPEEKQKKEKFYEKARGDSLQELAGKIGLANVPGMPGVTTSCLAGATKVDFTNVPGQPGVTTYCPAGATDPYCPAGATGPTDTAEAFCYCKDTYRCPPCNERDVERYILLKKPRRGIKSVTQEVEQPSEGVRDIGGLSNANADYAAQESWKIRTGEATRNWTEDQRKSEEAMIQSLKDPTWICVESGAGESFCPVEAFPDFETHVTNKSGKKYRAAGGQERENVGERDLVSKATGSKLR